VTYDIDYCLEDTLRYTVLSENIEQETKDFLNSLADESEMENEEKDQDDKNHDVIDVDTFGNPRSLDVTRRSILTNHVFNGNEPDGSIEEFDGNVSEFSFEELSEMSDIESITTTDSNNE